jgi:hypothetical protein
MGLPARVAGVLAFVLFVGVVAVRPLATNPAISGTLDEGGGWQLLAVFPLLVVTVLVVALRVRSLTGAESDTDKQRGTGGSDETFWDARTANSPAEAGPSQSGATDGDEGPQDGQSSDDGPTQGAAILGGQGGTRDREFDIEEQPPDATLGEHLEHLQAELDDDETVTQDLKTLEAVAEQTAGDRTVPARCPQDHCDAVWTGRTVLGVASGHYEILEDGERVQCLECEEIHTLE